MHANPLISIIIPHFNRAELLRETIASIKNQSYKNWEIILVDDGSTEEQWKIIQSYESEQIHILKRTDGQKGPSRCRNIGVEKSWGTYFMFVDSDDILVPWCLSKRLEKIQKYPKGELWIFPVMIFKKKPGDLSLCWNRMDGEGDLDRFLCSDPPWHISSSFWTKEGFKKVKGFNEAISYGEDVDLHIKVLLKGVDFKKFSFNLPDAFIRRGDEERRTKDYSREMLESRRMRLLEGTKSLKKLNATQHQKDWWEGQYIVEAEQLLVNVDNSEQSIDMVLGDWISEYHPTKNRQFYVNVYFSSGRKLRKHISVVVKAKRRWVKLKLPPEYFPSSETFLNWPLRSGEVKRLKEKLRGLKG